MIGNSESLVAKVGYINFAVLKLEETEIQAVTTFTQFGG